MKELLAKVLATIVVTSALSLLGNPSATAGPIAPAPVAHAAQATPTGGFEWDD